MPSSESLHQVVSGVLSDLSFERTHILTSRFISRDLELANVKGSMGVMVASVEAMS